MEMPTIDGDSPVLEIKKNDRGFPKYHEARQTLWETGSVTIQG